MRDTEPRLDRGEALAVTGVGCFLWVPATGQLILDPVGRDALDLLPGEYHGLATDLRPKILRDDWTLLSGLSAELRGGRKDAYSAYFRVALHDGRSRWTHVRGNVVRDGADGPTRVVGVVRDATLDLSHSSLRPPADEDSDHLHALGEAAIALARAMSVREVAAVLGDEPCLRRLE